jgi:hypothetical protein
MEAIDSAHPKADERPTCWICAWVFARDRAKTNHCQKCGRGFCEDEHGKVSEGIGICLICSELEKSPYECGCGWLERAAHDLVVPVGFDPEVKQFHIEYHTEGGMKGRMVVRYCPSCGGAAPRSIRENLFQYVTAEESYRLGVLTAGFRTVSDVLAAFGPPDEDVPSGWFAITSEKDGQLGREIPCRLLQYDNLSSFAKVAVLVHIDQSISFAFVPKPKAKGEG